MVRLTDIFAAITLFAASSLAFCHYEFAGLRFTVPIANSIVHSSYALAFSLAIVGLASILTRLRETQPDGRSLFGICLSASIIFLLTGLLLRMLVMAKYEQGIYVEWRFGQLAFVAHWWFWSGLSATALVVNAANARLPIALRIVPLLIGCCHIVLASQIAIDLRPEPSQLTWLALPFYGFRYLFILPLLAHAIIATSAVKPSTNANILFPILASALISMIPVAEFIYLRTTML